MPPLGTITPQLRKQGVARLIQRGKPQYSVALTGFRARILKCPQGQLVWLLQCPCGSLQGAIDRYLVASHTPLKKQAFCPCLKQPLSDKWFDSSRRKPYRKCINRTLAMDFQCYTRVFGCFVPKQSNTVATTFRSSADPIDGAIPHEPKGIQKCCLASAVRSEKHRVRRELDIDIGQTTKILDSNAS